MSLPFYTKGSQIMPVNLNPDDFCRRCSGTGIEHSVVEREGRKINLSEPCSLCDGVGEKIIIRRGSIK